MPHLPPLKLALDALYAIDPGIPRQQWLSVAAGAKAAGISLEAFDEWSKRAGNYAGLADVRLAWNERSLHTDAHPGWLYGAAKDAGWEPTAAERHEWFGDDRKGTHGAAPRHPRGVSSAPARMPDKAPPGPTPEERAASEAVRAKVKSLLALAGPASDEHPYLKRKEVSGDGILQAPIAGIVATIGYHPALPDRKQGGKRVPLRGAMLLIVPLHGGDGNVQTVEFIDDDGRKVSLSGLERKGMMWGPSSLNNPEVIGIAEGVATAKSAAAATPCPTFAAGSITNIGNVLAALQERYPTAEFIIFADLLKDQPVCAQSTLDLARENACVCVVPDWTRVGVGGTDFNDMERFAGVDAVYEWIASHRTMPGEISWLGTERKVDIDYVFPGLPVGAVGLIAGEGGIGKTFLALDLCASVALGRSVSKMPGGYATPPVGRTALVLGEDPPDIIHNRMVDMRSVHGMSEGDITRLSSAMRVIGTVGEDMRVAAVLDRGGTVDDGPFLARLRHLCRGRRLVIIDPLIRLHDGNENDNNVANKLLLRIQRVALDTHCAILLLHHAGKGEGKSGWQLSRGASAYTTSVRWQINMVVPTEEDGQLPQGESREGLVRLAGVKANYGPKAGEVWMRRGQGGVLQYAEIVTSQATDPFAFVPAPDTGHVRPAASFGRPRKERPAPPAPYNPSNDDDD